MRRRPAAVLMPVPALALAALTLVGCGGKTSPDTGSGPDNPADAGGLTESPEPTDVESTVATPSASPSASSATPDAGAAPAAATCELAGGTFTAEPDAAAGTETLTWSGLDVPADAGSVLYSATYDGTQLGIKVVGEEVTGFVFDGTQQTELDAGDVTVSEGETSAVFPADQLPAAGGSYRATLNVDGTDTESCDAPRGS